jgi:hypothetical protein
MLSIQLDQENKIYKSEKPDGRMGSAGEHQSIGGVTLFFMILNYIKLNKPFYDRNLPR